MIPLNPTIKIIAAVPRRGAALLLAPLFALMVLGSIYGCAAVKRPTMPMVRIEGTKRPYFAGQILDIGHQEVMEYSGLVHRLAQADVVFIGETHDNPDHHLIQVQLLQSLLEKWGKLTLAVEFLPYEMQPIIDRYMAGAISEKDFLHQVEWRQTWGFDYHFYRPLLQLVKLRGGHVIAINAPQKLVKKVAKDGLDSLGPAERGLLPREIDLTDKAHREYLREIYGSHAHEKLKKFEFFYEAQCVWEETMAEHVADYLERKKGKIVVICGSGHIYYDFGIPKRLRRRCGARTATLIPYPVGREATIKRNIANFLWLTGKYFPRGHMGRHDKGSARPL
ncbi:MAG: hypothetical protein DRH12_10845 [Deltaproteobacteria bacterium]|nr:MAG: hypothetical protein DRH12_10845 [Deltaproteobacteria bacterium]